MAHPRPSVLLGVIVIGLVALHGPLAAGEAERPGWQVAPPRLAPGAEARELLAKARAALRRAEDAVPPDTGRSDFEESERLAARVLELDDSLADAHFVHLAARGRLLQLDGGSINPLRLLEANRALDRALELDPVHADSLGLRGALYRNLPRLLGGDTEKAEQFLRRSIEVAPDRVIGPRAELSHILAERGDVAGAIRLVEAALAIAERDGRVKKQREMRELLEKYAGALRVAPTRKVAGD